MAENKAIIEHNGDCKYIFAKVQEGQDTHLAVVSMRLGYHRDIADTLEGRLDRQGQRLAQVLGGGRLAIDREAKTIETYDYSGSYGHAPLNLVEAVLRENFPDYKLDIR